MSPIAGKMQTENLNIDFLPSLDYLHDMLAFVKASAKKINFTEKQMLHLEVAAEEAFVNIISYANLQPQDAIHIRCEHCQNPAGIKITFTDSGIPFNPLTQPKKFDPNFKQETKGGLGIFFILTIMDEVVYKRDKNTNVLALTLYKE